MTDVLVVAGEASGDRAAAATIERLRGVHVFGLGGAAMLRAGAELLAELSLSTALGFGEAARRSMSIAKAWRIVTRAALGRRPSAALLVNYTEFNTRLALKLHAAGIPVIWYGAPQIWAWRSGRANTLRRCVDRMAVMLPFEESMWRAAGVDADYVGHPALEPARKDRATSRRILSIPETATAIGILPGSRPHEVVRLLPSMVEALRRLARRRPGLEGRVVVAPSLDGPSSAQVRAACARHQIPMFHVDPMAGAVEILSAFDAVLCASGTASLEAVLARTPPVIAYRVGVATSLVARALLRSPHIGLPNVLLGRRVFPELVQHDATPARMTEAIDRVLEHRDELVRACDTVTAGLECGERPSENVARMIERWI